MYVNSVLILKDAILLKWNLMNLDGPTLVYSFSFDDQKRSFYCNYRCISIGWCFKMTKSKCVCYGCGPHNMDTESRVWSTQYDRILYHKNAFLTAFHCHWAHPPIGKMVLTTLRGGQNSLCILCFVDNRFSMSSISVPRWNAEWWSHYTSLPCVSFLLRHKTFDRMSHAFSGR
jgi:hypothetical protein